MSTWTTWTIISIGTHEINNNIFSAYYNTRDHSLGIAFNGHTIYIKWKTAKEHAIDLLKSKFKAGSEEIEYFKKLDLRKLKIPT